IGSQALEAVLDSSFQVLPARSRIDGPLPYPHPTLGRQNNVIASAAHALAGDLLRGAGGVAAGRVAEGHTTVEGCSEWRSRAARPKSCDPFESATGSERDGAQGQS